MSDLLLEWMSFRCEGRLDELPAELTGGRPRRILEDLCMLGHVEMTGASSWRVAAPALAGLPIEAGAEVGALLCGARTPGVMARVAAATAATGAQMHVATVADRSSRVWITSTTLAGVADAAGHAGIRLQPGAGYSLLACLPTIRDWPRQQCQMVAGRVETVRRFSGSKARWIESSLGEATAATKGFFRIKRDWDWVSIIKSSQFDCAYIDDRAGRMACAQKLRYASWDPPSKILGFPIRLFPPAIMARALALCTGDLPQFHGGRVLFGGVNPAMLRLTLAITGLRLA